jgi:predicted RNA-binding protein Jag
MQKLSSSSKFEHVKNKWQPFIEEFAKSSKEEWVSPPGLSSLDRKIIHELAETFHFTSQSKGEGAHRVVIVSRKNNGKEGI